MLPFPSVAQAAEEDTGGGGTSGGGTYITVNGGHNTLGNADSVTVATSVTNITANNVTVYVSGDYNPQYLFHPRVTELHMLNNSCGALWNPKLADIPKTFNAEVMKQAKIAILYDGWIDLENVGPKKPAGATRYGEILGYDIYAPNGESYILNSAGKYTYVQPVSYLSSNSTVSASWAVMQLYRALGKEQVHFYAQTESVPEDYDINSSPLVQALTMPIDSPDLKDGITNVAATRTIPADYLKMAQKDCLGISAESSTVTVADFCTLASTLMSIYGEPVLAEQETYMLLEAYGADLPYGLPENQLAAIKYLLARGIISADMSWRSNITFDQAATILMRIKDKDSRLTFKNIDLTTNIELLKNGYHPIEVADYQAPISIVNSSEIYTEYTIYDYFVECVSAFEFKSKAGVPSDPFICAGYDNADGVMPDTSYAGHVFLDGKDFYHFQVKQTAQSITVNGYVYINTALSDDTPYRYRLPAPGADGNPGGVYLYNGGTTYPEDGTVATWEFLPLDNTSVSVPSAYCDKPRKTEATKTATTQTALFNTSQYGFTIRVYDTDASKISFEDESGKKRTLDKVTAEVKLKNSMSIVKARAVGTHYLYFTVKGCSNKNTLSEIFKCDKGTAYHAFPAFSKGNNQYLVSIDYLKSIGVVWDFIKTGESSYYIGVLSKKSAAAADATLYTDVYIGTSTKSSYIIRGTQMTIYSSDNILVWESDSGYYVDYAAVLGISSVVSFPNKDGTVTLTEESALDGVVSKPVYNCNNTSGSSPDHEWMATVAVSDGSGNTKPYIYAPITYPLANWIVVDNKISQTQGVFSFYATQEPDKDSEGAKVLADYLGAKTTSDHWGVTYSTSAALIGMRAKHENGKYSLASGVKFGPLLYIPEENVYLIQPNYTQAGATYGEFAKSVSSHVTSIVYTSEGNWCDWNNNLYQTTFGWGKGSAIHLDSNNNNTICDISGWTGNKNRFPNCTHNQVLQLDWIPAPTGIPALLGYPASTSGSLTTLPSTCTYSGIAKTVRNGVGTAVWATSKTKKALEFSVIHATPYKAWLQSCGFGFTFLAASPLAEAGAVKPTLDAEGAEAGFDWAAFLKELNMKNTDDWLTIAIIAVLSILPRIFMFMFILLMGLALIADVKPWQIFCDSVVDPYRILTFGRKDVHTIRVKMVFLYSLIALILYGMFQNGLILNVIAWVARAVTGILRR